MWFMSAGHRSACGLAPHQLGPAEQKRQWQLRRLALGILHPFLGDHPQRVKRGVLITIAGELRHMMF